MNFEPQKFFIGLVDLFSILMPGALLAYLSKDWAGPLLPGELDSRLDGAEAWLVFLFASYLLGHIAFLIGSLSDKPYDRFRKCTYLGQIQGLAEGEPLRSQRMRAIVGWLFGGSADAALMQAVRIKSRALRPLFAENAINAYQWCKVRLSKDHPEGLVAVQRFEADSKFFRSFVVVLALLALIFAWQDRPILSAACVVFLLPALWRYVDQRFKATQQAYWYVITLEGMKGPSALDSTPTRRPDGLTHAGGVVFCQNGFSDEYLLVQASKDRNQWVLPKGHIEPGEDPKETAVREVKEETGHWARIVWWLGDSRLGTDANTSVVRFYLMELVEQGENWPAENREQQWLPLPEAKQRASFDETEGLLEKAATKTATSRNTVKGGRK